MTGSDHEARTLRALAAQPMSFPELCQTLPDVPSWYVRIAVDDLCRGRLVHRLRATPHREQTYSLTAAGFRELSRQNQQEIEVYGQGGEAA